MQTAPAPHQQRKPLTFTESVLAQLRTWPWTEMDNLDPSAHNPSSIAFKIHSNPQEPSATHNPPAESDDPEERW
jgi:hypothetical protein